MPALPCSADKLKIVFASCILLLAALWTHVKRYSMIIAVSAGAVVWYLIV